MRKIITLLTAILFTCTAYSQDTTGMIAHWKLDGNAFDATGHGHNGIARNVIPTVGKGGKPNTACYFNGVNSRIDVAYAPDLNITQYSICAIVKMSGFYSGNCQGNDIFTRVTEGQVGNYKLNIADNAYDSSCSIFDSTHEVFQNIWYGGGSHPYKLGEDTPLQENRWYSAVVTFDGTTGKIYVNGTLRVTVPGPSGAIGTNSLGASIGFNSFDTASYPYPFKGAIDDIRLYNRVLTDLEIAAYDTSTLPVAVNNAINNEPEIAVFPNPAYGRINVQLGDNNIKGAVQLLNAMGQLIAEKEINNGSVNFDIANLPISMYLLRMECNEQVFFRKFIKE